MTRNTITEIIIAILAIVSIVLVAVESLVTVPERTLLGIYVTDLIICIVFAWDFIQRLRISENKSHFMKTNGFEILAMIPAVAFTEVGAIPAISTGLRSLRLVRVVRVVLLAARMRRVISTSGRFFQRSHVLTMLGIITGIIFVSAFTVSMLEADVSNAQITSFPDAVWWSITTVTTVGYGDIVPHSVAGRIVGMVLMVVGIGVMATFISLVSATLVESRIKQDSGKSDLRTTFINEIKNKIDNIDKLNDGEVSLLMQMIQTLRIKVDE